jgi:hypothetical protein
VISNGGSKSGWPGRGTSMSSLCGIQMNPRWEREHYLTYRSKSGRMKETTTQSRASPQLRVLRGVWHAVENGKMQMVLNLY